MPNIIRFFRKMANVRSYDDGQEQSRCGRSQKQTVRLRRLQRVREIIHRRGLQSLLENLETYSAYAL